MEAVERDPEALPRILEALDLHARASADRYGEVDPEDQIDVLLRAVEGKGGERPGSRAPERRDPRLVELDEVRGLDLVVELAALVLLDPSTYTSTGSGFGSAVAPRQAVERAAASQEILRQLPLERDRIGAVPCHGGSLIAREDCQSAAPELSTRRGSLQP
jgi:hypothetical protein